MHESETNQKKGQIQRQDRMICKVLTQLGYTNGLIYTLLTVRLASACRTRSLRVVRMQSFMCMHFQLIIQSWSQQIIHSLFIIKSSKGYIQLSYSRLNTSLNSHFFSSLVSKITKRLWQVKRKLRTQITVPQGNFINMGFSFLSVFTMLT